MTSELGDSRPATGPVDGADRPASPRTPTKRVGRRVFLGMLGTGAAGVIAGSHVQRAVSKVLGSGLGNLVPGGARFRIYTLTGGFPTITRARYRLKVTGLVEHPLNLSVDDLEAMPRTELVKTFQCVTGWSVPNVHWEGVSLAEILRTAGVKAGAKALAFDSYDGVDTESLTLDQAQRSDVIVAYRMLGAPVTTEHGGPVRL